ncbi:TIGR01777 family oxidoreductase [Polaribacter ponticola]|uniref:TIGR01777 family oxidoreductase n=1 Tax=Polaribacter ponticola TaxID=2978475 RepID=A0ABT5SBG5_9FLAO|nr:TIGR01777 family oxidoreductase [Polaribacter sp. MSW5]MDD7914627.1 TIGR01777 family oxidoreductase [Polaribacter sp. MSW5]
MDRRKKKIIIDSRVKTANLLFNKIIEYKINLKGFISASGIGYYGAITNNKTYKETDKPGTDFIANVCKQWEKAAEQFSNKNIPVTILRTGIVLSKEGGALEKMKTPILSPLGSGKQHIPWIHIDDLCLMYLNAVEGNLTGVFNAVTPENHTSKTFSKTLAKNLKRPYLAIGVPSFLLKLMFGNLSVILLKGSKISAKKIEKRGFSFRFRTLKKALNNL